jgi:hypothetical protein
MSNEDLLLCVVLTAGISIGMNIAVIVVTFLK